MLDLDLDPSFVTWKLCDIGLAGTFSLAERSLSKQMF